MDIPTLRGLVLCRDARGTVCLMKPCAKTSFLAGENVTEKSLQARRLERRRNVSDFLPSWSTVWKPASGGRAALRLSGGKRRAS